MENKKGGKRENSGAKKKYGEETKMVCHRVPITLVNAFKKHCAKFLMEVNIFEAVDEALKDRKDLANQEIPSFIKGGIYNADSSIIPSIEEENFCDCKLDENDLLRRGKIKCTKTKDEHNF